MTIFSQYLYKLISYYSKEPTKRRGPSKYKRWKVLKKNKGMGPIKSKVWEKPTNTLLIHSIILKNTSIILI